MWSACVVYVVCVVCVCFVCVICVCCVCGVFCVCVVCVGVCSGALGEGGYRARLRGMREGGRKESEVLPEISAGSFPGQARVWGENVRAEMRRLHRQGQAGEGKAEAVPAVTEMISEHFTHNKESVGSSKMRETDKVRC